MGGNRDAEVGTVPYWRMEMKCAWMRTYILPLIEIMSTGTKWDTGYLEGTLWSLEVVGAQHGMVIGTAAPGAHCVILAGFEGMEPYTLGAPVKLKKNVGLNAVGQRGGANGGYMCSSTKSIGIILTLTVTKALAGPMVRQRRGEDCRTRPRIEWR